MNILQRILYLLFGKSHIDRLENRLNSIVSDAEAVAAEHLRDAAQAAEHIAIIEAAKNQLARDASKAQAVATAAKRIVNDII